MSKRKWTEEKIAKRIKEGRGVGEFSSYQPWLTVRDISSEGRSHRIKGIKTERLHHFLSDLERNYFYLLEWVTDVIDIREQFPLEREETNSIAETIGIKHPVYPRSSIPIVMTTDFLITRRVGNSVEYIARTVKPSEVLEDKRTIEKLEIEREYWEKKNINWGIVTEKEIPVEMINNIMWVHGAKFLENAEEEYLVDIFLNELEMVNPSIIMAVFTKRFEEEYRLNSGTALHLMKHLISNRVITFNMNQKFELQKPISEFTIMAKGRRSEDDHLVG